MTARIVPLSEAEETRLIADAQAGNERAMERLLEAYEPVIARTSRVHSHGDNHEDALQEARVAFIQVVQAHDLTRGVRLYSYVGTRLDHEMRDALSESQNPWGIPVRTMQRFYQVLTAAGGDVTAGTALAPTYRMDSLTFASIAQMLAMDSLDFVDSGEDGGSAVSDTYAGPVLGGESSRDMVDSLIDKMTVGAIMADTLSEEHLRVIRMAYGFEGDLEIDDLTAYVTPSTVSIAAHADTTVADAMTWQDKGKVWTRPTVQRLRTKQLAAWREAHNGEDN